MTTKVRGAKLDNENLDSAKRLLEELYRQRTELGEIATELISLLQAAGVGATDGPDNRNVDSPPE